VVNADRKLDQKFYKKMMFLSLDCQAVARRVMTLLVQVGRRALLWRQDNTEASSSMFNEPEAAFLSLIVIDLFSKSYEKEYG